MTDVIGNLAAIMRAELNTLDAIAQNSANANTNGFRAVSSARTGTDFFHTLSKPPGIPHQVSLDQRDGTAVSTGRSLDMSVFGDGWFSVAHPSGIKLTRDGHFSINSQGVLVSREGHPVLGESGEIIGFDELSRVDSNGEIFFSDGSGDQLRILAVKDKTKLRPLGNGLYESSEYTEAQNFRIVQGSLESSNVDLAADMIKLMRTTRHMETLQRAMSSYDQILDIGINQIGK